MFVCQQQRADIDAVETRRHIKRRHAAVNMHPIPTNGRKSEALVRRGTYRLTHPCRPTYTHAQTCSRRHSRIRTHKRTRDACGCLDRLGARAAVSLQPHRRCAPQSAAQFGCNRQRRRSSCCCACTAVFPAWLHTVMCKLRAYAHLRERVLAWT